MILLIGLSGAVGEVPRVQDDLVERDLSGDLPGSVIPRTWVMPCHAAGWVHGCASAVRALPTS
jgi:hypothetical protein